MYGSQPVLPPPLYISTDSLDADFANLLLNVCDILNSTPDHESKLEKCKKYCLLLRVGDCSNQPLYSTKKIEECDDFHQLCQILKWCMSWEEYSILKQIVDKCNSRKALKEIKKFDKKLLFFKEVQLVCNSSKYDVISEEVVRVLVIIDKPYNKISFKEYNEVKDCIVDITGLTSSVLTIISKLRRSSLHIEWLITVQAVPFMIEMAYQKKDIFIKKNFVFMQIGGDIIIDKVLIAIQLISFLFKP